MPSYTPKTEAELTDVIVRAAQSGEKLAVQGGGSKAEIGAPAAASILDMRGFAGITDYDATELVLTARAGTPLAEIEAATAGKGQMLAFDPFDHGPLFGKPAGAATIGGVIAAGIAGSRRISSGGARDHLLGFKAVSGRGEMFVAGSKVIKNVTGYDLPKLIAGSWGRLVALTEVTLKVLPAPRASVTRAISGLTIDQAYSAMARAMGSQAEVNAAAFIPADLRGGTSLTVLRLQGVGASIAARSAMIDAFAAGFGGAQTLTAADEDKLWRDVRTLAPLNDGRPLWRVSLPAKACVDFVGGLKSTDARWLADWAGGLIWLTADADSAVVRKAATDAGGHAMLVRGDGALRARTPVFQPQPAPIAALEARVRRAFDPAAVFETGRFGEMTDGR